MPKFINHNDSTTRLDKDQRRPTMAYLPKCTQLSILLGSLPLLVCVGCKEPPEPVIRETAHLTESVDIFEKPLIPKPEKIPQPQVVATVNGLEIHQDQLDREVKNITARMRNQLPPERIAQEKNKILNQALNNLVVQNLLWSSVDSENVEVQDSEVEAALENVRASLPPDLPFTDFLKRSELTQTELAENIRTELRIKALVMQNIGEPPPPTDEDISKFYEANKEQYKVPDRVETDYYLVRVPKDADPVLTQERIDLASTIQAFAAEGKPVSEILAMYPDSEIVRGGPGIFARGQIEKNLEEVLFALETNQTSEVSNSPLGLHIFRAKKHMPAGVLSLGEVKESISNGLTQRETQNRINTFMADLREKAQIEVHP